MKASGLVFDDVIIFQMTVVSRFSALLGAGEEVFSNFLRVCDLLFGAIL